uniref:Peptidase S1 domain-containing protein n=1 Tax=Clastoptera arizonana TaxID=38151 RepID=A0A1B6DA35_9HEMI
MNYYALVLFIKAATSLPFNLIVSGSTDATTNQFPYHVSMMNQLGDDSLEFLCSGAIIDSTHVVTTASGAQINGIQLTSSIRILSGSNELDFTKATSHQISSYKLHNNYIPKTFENDIVIFEVTPQFTFSGSTNSITVSNNWTADISVDCVISSFAEPISDFQDGISSTLKYENIVTSGCSVATNNSFCIADKTTGKQTTDKNNL